MNRSETDKGTPVVVTLTVMLMNRDIDSIMCTALEGGITYWCSGAEAVGGKYLGEYAHEQISRGGALKLYDAEDDTEYELTKDKFINGFRKAYEDGYLNGACAGDRIDTGEVDAEIADVIVQFALFGEVVYG